MISLLIIYLISSHMFVVFGGRGRGTKTVYESLTDLSIDPYEKSNMISSTDYSTDLKNIKSRLEYWKKQMLDPDIPSTSNMKKAYEKCGGVCPWITSSFIPENTPIKYTYSKAPHIVFVLVDDWGYNDVGWRSTYLDWGTPTIDKIASNGIIFSNYFTHSQSLPSRGAILTGRYSLRLGLWESDEKTTAELPLSESILAQELKTAGYRNYMIGKWGLGKSTINHNPINRGFDYFYGHLSDSIDPWIKKDSSNYYDLYENSNLVTNPDEISDKIHIATLFQQKTISILSNHVSSYQDTPMFLFYSLPLMSSFNSKYSIPSSYLQHCSIPSSSDVSDATLRSNIYNYCGMTKMLDEIIANLTCILQSNGMDENLVMIITSDNGGDTDTIPGTNYPYIGGKGDHSRGGVSVNAILHGSTLPSNVRGQQFSGISHVTDWYPTILGLATNNEWTTPLNKNPIDGMNIWQSLLVKSDTNRDEIVHAFDTTEYSIQIGTVKYDYGIKTHLSNTIYSFSDDQAPDMIDYSCDSPAFGNDVTPISVSTDDAVLSKHMLYDLGKDWLESLDLYDRPTVQEVQVELLARASYWQSQVIQPYIPINTDLKHKSWKDCGGICPWTTEKFTPLSIPNKYSYSDAPHIIFVLVDDWGWNDWGLRSTYMSWTTPNIDRLGMEGITLQNYYSHSTCVPSRAAFLTARYSIRTGMWQTNENAELPLSETTIAQELKSAGYRTYLVGKWHLGFSTIQHLPTYRGFDSFYGYLSGFVDYWTKEYGSYLDLMSDTNVVTDPEEISDELHNSYLMQSKAELVIKEHNTYHADKPMFLYYAMQLIHGVWSAPDIFLDRCGLPAIDSVGTEYLQSVEYNYCALNVMLDEAIANLTCTLEKYNMVDNTVLVIASDNGGETTLAGNNYPFRGGKGSTARGGVSVNALIHSKLIPDLMRGQSYDGLMHVTDWLPTFMHLATGGTWTGSLTGANLDGINMWDAILSNSNSPRHEIVHYADGSQSISFQLDNIKLMLGVDTTPYGVPLYQFERDQTPETAHFQCSSPSLIYGSSDTDDPDFYDGEDDTNDDRFSRISSADDEKSEEPRKHRLFTLQGMIYAVEHVFEILAIAIAAILVTSSVILSIHTCKYMIEEYLFPNRIRRRDRRGNREKLFYTAETVGMTPQSDDVTPIRRPIRSTMPFHSNGNHISNDTDIEEPTDKTPLL